MTATLTTADAIGSNVGTLPVVDGYLGYVDAASGYEYLISYALIGARFPGKPVKSITTQSSAWDLTADICDCESGDFTPQLAASWALAKIQANLGRPTIYCSTSLVGAVIAALQAVGLVLGTAGQVDWLAAAYSDPPDESIPSTPVQAIGHQYEDAGTYDLSLVDASWLLGTTPSPTKQEDDMGPTIAFDAKGDPWIAATGSDGNIYTGSIPSTGADAGDVVWRCWTEGPGVVNPPAVKFPTT